MLLQPKALVNFVTRHCVLQPKKPSFQPSPVIRFTPMETVDRISRRATDGHDDVPKIAKRVELLSSAEDFTQAFIDKIAEQKGDRPITFLSTPVHRKELSHQVAEGFRLNEDYGVVLDPSELVVDGWKSADYRRHWNEVRETFSKDMQMVMAPGWTENKHCLRAARHANSLGIPIKQLEEKPLSRTDIEIRLAESEAELRHRGFESPNFVDTLNGAVDQKYLDDKATEAFTSEQTLKDPKQYVFDVVARTLHGVDDVENDGAKQAGKIPQPEFTRLYVEAAKEQLNGQPMTYISTPITGGTKKFELFEELGIKDKSEFDESAKHRFVKDVIIKNTNQAFRISEGVRENQEVGMVMDPSEITIPEWSQSHYAAHWDAVVKELASKVVLAPGWDFSTGCVLELKRALDKGIPVGEIAVTQMSPGDVDRLLAKRM